MGFKLSFAANALAKELDDASKNIKIAGVRAVNKTAVQVRNLAQRETRKVLNLKASKIKRAYSIRRANKKQAIPISRVKVRYIQFPLSSYSGYRQTKKGVTVKMRKDMGRKLFKEAFIAKMPTGHVGVYWREGKKRLPIKEIVGPNPLSIFIEKLAELEIKGNQIFDRVYNHELNFILGRV